MPMFVEDIPQYIALKDYENNRIKKIQTIGKFISTSEDTGELESLTPKNTCKFPVSLRHLAISNKYIKASDDGDLFCSIWERYDVFKVYGTLTVEEELGHFLKATHFVPVHDIEGTWKVINVLKSVARTELCRYYRTPEQSSMLRSQLKQMKLKRKGQKEKKQE